MNSREPSSSRRESGFGLLSKASRVPFIWEPLSDKASTARFQFRSRSIKIVLYYAPTESSNVVEKDSFYGQLNQIRRGFLKLIL